MEAYTKILWAEKTTLAVGAKVRKHTHEYYHLFYVLSGSCEFVVEDKSFIATADNYILFPPNAPHEILENKNAEKTVNLEIKFALYDDNIDKILKKSEISIQSNQFVRVMSIYIINNWLSSSYEMRKNVSLYLYSILLYLTNVDSNVNRIDSRYIDISCYDEISRKIIRHIEENYAVRFSLKNLGRTLGYNSNYLCYVFKNNTGITIVEYLNYIRIRRAAELFSYSGECVQTAGSIVGFENISHFSRTFKKIVGVSSNQYKAALQIRSDGSLGSFFPSDTVLTGQAPNMEEALERLKRLGKAAMLKE